MISNKTKKMRYVPRLFFANLLNIFRICGIMFMIFI